MNAGRNTARTPLLEHSGDGTENNVALSRSTPSADNVSSSNHGVLESTITRFLPIAFTASFAIAATSATSMYAYASIVCADAAHCKDGEQDRYAGIVALATAVANFFGILTVGFLRPWTETHAKIGLYFWIVCRSVSIGTLGVGVLLGSIRIAIAGKIFEGLATDNILQYTLAAVYLRTKVPGRFSQLMGTSLALYMIGMSLSPTIVTFLPNFFVSFVVAIALLGLSYCYLYLLVPFQSGSSWSSQQQTSLVTICTSSFEHILYFYREPIIALPSLAILAYNSAQSYLFPMLMVHTALKYGFTSTENGYLISLAAATSSVYLLATLYVFPKIRYYLHRNKGRAAEDSTENGVHGMDDVDIRSSGTASYLDSDLVCAIVAMTIQLIVLPLFTIVHSANAVYGFVVLISFGLAAPSFIKSYAVTIARERSSAVAMMAVAESTGGLLSPVILGTVQTLVGQKLVFIVASSLVGAAILFLVTSVVAKTCVRVKVNG